MLFTGKWVDSFKRPFDRTQSREKRAKIKEDLVTTQVKSLLQTSDQKLILMVRG